MTDAQIQYYERKLAYEIDSWDLKVALDSGDSVVVIDVRSADAHIARHIRGSINIPHRAMSTETTSNIDRNATVVTYCDGIGCNASTKGSLNLARLGFNVRELIGGLGLVDTRRPPDARLDHSRCNGKLWLRMTSHLRTTIGCTGDWLPRIS